ncbi:MAG: hypothetical protein AB7P34_02180 [Vicinamibacterales bacterium]
MPEIPASGGMRAAAWSALALAVLLWPARIAGVFDGAPLDGGAEAVAIGFLLPVLCWFHGGFFRGRLGPALIVLLALVRIVDAQMTTGGWCVRFDTPRPIVRDSTGRPHSWDVRADWRSPNPRCSAVMTSGYGAFKRFPVWFFNLPPIDNNLPTADDRPPYTTATMTVTGVIDVIAPGAFDLQLGRHMPASVIIGGRAAEPHGDFGYRLDVPAGVHLVQIETTLQGNQWAFMPSWNQQPMGAAGFPLATVDRPHLRDRGWPRWLTGWAATVLAFVLLGAWTVSALRTWGDVRIWLWVAGASAWLAYLAPRPGNDYVTSTLARWSVAALAFALLLLPPVRERWRTLRGAFMLVGIPWLVFVGVAAFDHVGKFSFYHGGDDQWTYQRFAYRIFLQGYWLEGGTPTFWFQPGYRWVAGAMHMVFGDSSIGEFYLDGAGLLLLVLFAYGAASRLAGFRWGLAAAGVVFTLIMQGPAWRYWGVGLSENVAAGFIYGAALAAMFADTWRLRLVAGVLALLGFYTRLNNLPLALAIALFALPVTVRVRDLWTPREWLSTVDWRTATTVVGVVLAGLFLFALRTWYYTGIFSVFHGTTLGHNGLIQPGVPALQIAGRMADSVWMVLSLNDPPRFAWYAVPVIGAAVIALAALAGVPKLRDLPLSLVMFLMAALAGALVARGEAYAGRFSTIILGSAAAIFTGAAALVTGAIARWPQAAEAPPAAGARDTMMGETIPMQAMEQR